MPNGKVLKTNGSGVINTTYTGYGGAITYYTQKNNVDTNIDNSGIAGNIYRNANAAFSAAGCPLLTGIESPFGTVINCGGSTLLSNIIAPKASIIYASGCALTAKSIGDILYAAYTENRENVIYDFNGGTNAYYGLIDSYLNDNCSGLTLSEVETALSGLGGTLVIEP